MVQGAGINNPKLTKPQYWMFNKGIKQTLKIEREEEEEGGGRHMSKHILELKGDLK